MTMAPPVSAKGFRFILAADSNDHRPTVRLPVGAAVRLRSESLSGPRWCPNSVGASDQVS